MKQPSEEEVIEALERSGYLFEQDIATLLGNLDFHVETSWAYPDPDEEKSREIDVRAFKQVVRDEEHKFQIFIELLVECKDYSSPLVFLERRKNAREMSRMVPSEYLFPFQEYYERLPNGSVRAKPAFPHLGLRDKHYYYRDERTTTQFSKIVRKGDTWMANHDGIYDSLILPLAKVLQYRKKEARRFVDQNEWKTTWLFFPVVVLRDYLCVYDLSGPKRTLFERGRVSFVRHLESQNLKGYFLTDFVTYRFLEKYVCDEIGSFCAAILDVFRKDPKVLTEKMQ